MSNVISESFLKQSEEFSLSKSDKIYSFEEENLPQESNISNEEYLVEISWKTVRFSERVRHIYYPKYIESDNENPIKALHHIRYHKGVAWLKACQKVKNILSTNEFIRQRLTLSKLDMILEREYMHEVKAINSKEENEDQLKNIEETIDQLNQENELLKMEVIYLGAKKKQLATEYLK